MQQPVQIRWQAESGHVLVADGHTYRSLSFAGLLDVSASNGQHAKAAGLWHLIPASDGLHLTVTLPSERYVAAVLTAEAEPTAPPEALKALAVVARSFALTNMQRHGTEGVCDSTHCQAMRLDEVSPRVEAAVQSTAGETLWHGTTRVPGYFSQSCGGITEDASQAWGGPQKAWLISHPDPFCQQSPSQWHAELSEADVRTALAREGWPLSGKIDSVTMRGRDTGGRVGQLLLHAGGSVAEVPAGGFRFAVNRALGWNQIRSDRYTVHLSGTKLVFDGRGYGHGVGLCQAGSSEMAREGRNYREILAFYFASALVRIEPADRGWRQVQRAGFSLRSTHGDAALASLTERALAEARQRWPTSSRVHPEVTIYPTTELFRQSTQEPGWVLASTGGTRVSLQPAALLQRHQDMPGLLRHEMLHVLIEADSGANAPLWLREGLVEVLDGEPCAGGVVIRAEGIDVALRRPESLRTSQDAHRTACVLARRSFKAHGLEALRSWLRNGVPSGIQPGE